MKKLNLKDVSQYVEKNIGTFHAKRIQSLDGLKLTQVLSEANLGYWASSGASGVVNAGVTGAAGAAGYIGGAWAGAKLGASIGWIGGPAGGAIGAIVGAGIGAA